MAMYFMNIRLIKLDQITTNIQSSTFYLLLIDMANGLQHARNLFGLGPLSRVIDGTVQFCRLPGQLPSFWKMNAEPQFRVHFLFPTSVDAILCPKFSSKCRHPEHI